MNCAGLSAGRPGAVFLVRFFWRRTRPLGNRQPPRDLCLRLCPGAAASRCYVRTGACECWHPKPLAVAMPVMVQHRAPGTVNRRRRSASVVDGLKALGKLHIEGASHQFAQLVLPQAYQLFVIPCDLAARCEMACQSTSPDRASRTQQNLDARAAVFVCAR